LEAQGWRGGDARAAGCGGDVIWPAQFAANGWILDLSDRFTAAVKGDKPVGQALE
jgi:hypothetical protein